MLTFLHFLRIGPCLVFFSSLSISPCFISFCLLTLPVAGCSGTFSCSGDLMRKTPLKTKRCLDAALLSQCAPSLIQGAVTCSRFQRAWDKMAMLSTSQDSRLLLATSRISPVSLPVTSGFCPATLPCSLSL